MADFKAPARIKDRALLRLLKYEYDCCEITGETRDLHLHHIVFKSSGGSVRGDDLRENIVCVTEWFHRLLHAGDPWAMKTLAEHIDINRSDIAAYISEKLGSPDALLNWFDRHHYQGT